MPSLLVFKRKKGKKRREGERRFQPENCCARDGWEYIRHQIPKEGRKKKDPIGREGGKGEQAIAVLGFPNRKEKKKKRLREKKRRKKKKNKRRKTKKKKKTRGKGSRRRIYRLVQYHHYPVLKRKGRRGEEEEGKKKGKKRRGEKKERKKKGGGRDQQWRNSFRPGLLQKKKGGEGNENGDEDSMILPRLSLAQFSLIRPAKRRGGKRRKKKKKKGRLAEKRKERGKGKNISLVYIITTKFPSLRSV